MDAEVRARAAVHRALGEPTRLALVDALAISDRTAGELQALTGLASNLLAFHLRVLEEAEVVERRSSEGDRRRRYVRLRPGALEDLAPRPALGATTPLFVCTANSARSQFAAALWRRLVGAPAGSAGSAPADRVHPLAVAVAADHGLDLGAARPRGYDAVADAPDLVVSVCDRAAEGGVPFAAPRVHWSVPDPVEPGRRPRRSAFERAFADIAQRVERLAGAVA